MGPRDYRSRTRAAALLLAIVVLATVGAAPASAAGGAGYRVVDLGTLTGEACCSEATAVNDRGDVVGSSWSFTTSRYAFVWRAGRMTSLGTAPGGIASLALDVNNRGDVVGYTIFPGGTTHATLWRGGTAVDLGVFPGGDNSYASAINDRGEVVGWSATEPNNGRLHAFRWRDGSLTDLGTPDGYGSVAYDVNARGQVVGSSTTPVLWSARGVTRLGTEPGRATAINARGHVVGNTQSGQAFIWREGRFTDLPRQPGATFHQPQGINDRDQVVGGNDFDAWTWQRGRTTLLPRLAGGAGAAEDINNNGAIVGQSATTPDGLNPHAVLWTR
ncbi:hypothetical protein [Asanoa siamensis]|uniref:HAF family extracellular repeat protein n=1 Tax=Asanoa siamensis TaxID=926357 RepID=A0ABQ4CLW1_9ACTN|nr:hypothetical protein [Asanoa siamensis]GIF72264.1 hypothetical protein Asi02nite_17820 [Asanoa siamensis]